MDGGRDVWMETKERIKVLNKVFSNKSKREPFGFETGKLKFARMGNNMVWRETFTRVATNKL